MMRLLDAGYVSQDRERFWLTLKCLQLLALLEDEVLEPARPAAAERRVSVSRVDLVSLAWSYSAQTIVSFCTDSGSEDQRRRY